jgi:hypothetical protein
LILLGNVKDRDHARTWRDSRIELYLTSLVLIIRTPERRSRHMSFTLNSGFKFYTCQENFNSSYSLGHCTATDCKFDPIHVERQTGMTRKASDYPNASENELGSWVRAAELALFARRGVTRLCFFGGLENWIYNGEGTRPPQDPRCLSVPYIPPGKGAGVEGRVYGNFFIVNLSWIDGSLNAQCCVAMSPDSLRRVTCCSKTSSDTFKFQPRASLTFPTYITSLSKGSSQCHGLTFRHDNSQTTFEYHDSPTVRLDEASYDANSMWYGLAP